MEAAMNRLQVGVLLTLTLLSPTALGADPPAFKPGRSEVVFTQAAPQSSSAELKRRFRAVKDAPPFDLAKETFLVDVPRSYKPDSDAWGLFVWVDPSPRPNISEEWQKVLAGKKLLLVAAHDSGNDRNLFDRCRLAIDAVHNMKQRLHVDPARVYVSGLSGGGRVASMLGVAYADVFTGTFPMVGVNFYKPVSTGEANKAWLPVYRPDERMVASAKAKNRYVLLTGENDFNRENTRRIHRDGFQAEGFRHTLYLEVPGMGHSQPPASWLAKGIDFLDGAGAEAPAPS
jgi:predicted esterase